jgi:hypothetical protein
VKAEVFVEGKADKKFIEDYISHLSGEDFSLNFKVNPIGGIGELENTKPLFITNDKTGTKNILILDADGKPDGRKSEITAFISKTGIDIDFFLFPNDSGKGDLETLLQEIINLKNKAIFECWDAYEVCLSSKENVYSTNKNYTTPARKTKIYAYLEAMLGTSKAQKELLKEEKRNYQEVNHWDLNHSFLDPLKSFLSKYL